jgi:hypothetical protein
MSKLPRLWKQWSVWPVQIATLNLEAQQVMALRMWRIMTGQRTQSEIKRMVAEKVAAAASEAQVGAAALMLKGGSQQRLARNTMRVYRRRVRRNRRRLLKRKS